MSETEQAVTLLLVDDEEYILSALRRLLMDEELDVVTAVSGEDGLEKLRDLQNVGLIISDQRMPGMNGAEFLGRSQEYAPHALRILLTGYSDISATIDAINRGGACRYISKPWNDEELVQTIRDAVRQYNLQNENRRLNAIVQQQNEELKEWNQNLKSRVLEQTTAIRQRNEELHALLAKIKNNYTGVITAFSGLVEMQGGRRHKHARMVADLSVKAAKELGLKNSEIESLKIAALLHDIGEFGISEDVLAMSAEAMSLEELKRYQQHPLRAQVIIDDIEDLRPVGVLIRHHHEHFDGSGFPDGLAGEAIPLGSRIIAYADHIDKVARDCVTNVVEQSLARTGLMLGTVLDPALSTAFRKVTKYVYFSVGQCDGDMVEIELPPKELKLGMQLSRDVCSESGILLLTRGSILDDSMVVAIQRNYSIDPPEHGVFVMAKI